MGRGSGDHCPPSHQTPVLWYSTDVHSVSGEPSQPSQDQLGSAQWSHAGNGAAQPDWDLFFFSESEQPVHQQCAL